MSAFNRVVALIVALVVLAGAVITLLVATGINNPGTYPWFESQLQRVADATGGSAAAIVAVSVIIALVMIALFILEAIPFRKPVPLLVSTKEEGTTTISKESVCILAEKAAAAVHGVHDVRCGIGEKVGGLVISCQVSVALGSNIPELSAELKNKVKDSVEQLTGLPVTLVDVETKYGRPVQAKRLGVR